MIGAVRPALFGGQHAIVMRASIVPVKTAADPLSDQALQVINSGCGTFFLFWPSNYYDKRGEGRRPTRGSYYGARLLCKSSGGPERL